MAMQVTWVNGAMRQSFKVWLWTMGLASLLIAAGCADDTEEGGVDSGVGQGDQGADNSSDAGAEDASETLSDTGGGTLTDAGTEDEEAGIPTELSVVEGESGQDCDAVCGGFGITCDLTCEIGGQTTAGYAQYGRVNFETGFDEYTDPVYHDTCGTVPESRVEAEGNTYNLAGWSCCCEAPIVTTVAGNVSTRATCEDICVAEGLNGCAEYHDWGSAGSGGVEMTYLRAETGGRAYITGSCATVPDERINYAQAWRDLESYQCACY